jgi:diguanylate cyclase (GGDEF)-like protein
MHETGPAPEAESISLLLVEEDEHTADRLFALLNRPESTRFEITLVPHVEDALVKVQEGGYDVMLLDLGFHEGHGLDSLMRARVAAQSVPIVVLTFQKDEAIALKAARAGAQDYLTKGEVTPDLLSRTLLHAVERHRILSDLTTAKQRQHFLASHDALTQLPNRYAFMAQLDKALADAERNKTQLAVLFFDLDGFKAVNDNRGHAAGDELLRDAARRLRKLIRTSDIVARLGGDEFVAAVRNVEDTATVIAMAERIREDIERPYHIAESECWVSTSIGVAFYPADSTLAGELIRCADTAMYVAKSSGKNQTRVFASEMNDAPSERFEMVNGLREAIRSGQLVLMFQPQIEVATEEIVGAETLVRWEHPTRGIVSPSEFITVAEETGMMVPLGEWVLQAACRAAMTWDPLPNMRVSVNVSGRQLDRTDFPDRVGAILQETGLPPHRLELELTESLAASESALVALSRLREMGVRTAIDDFGTGHSSLALLKRLPVDMLKVDQSFVRGASETDPDAVILEAIIHIARGLGLDVIAEGIETPEQMASLCKRGCTLMQGYLFSKPIRREDFMATVTAPDAQWKQPVAALEGWEPPQK